LAENRQFHKFIIITIIVPFAHDSVIRRENASILNLRSHSLARVYGKDVYKEWNDRYSHQDKETVKWAAERLREPMEILLQASAVGSKKRLWAVVAEIAAKIDRCRDDFNLKQPTNEILEKRGSRFIPNRPLKWEHLMSLQAMAYRVGSS